ncbi:hypothetical protein M23134_01908 [Microscilla marina ATCC 23134]|uniref:Uncharacterized protein n=1 Tax=Microscilla marina ATCC 23134 TaxID=313606 RepID=A1ZC76_MICM2|nr:hypothetical protein M23134_01908 [Microscilla marina ATCC 23134]
MKGLKYISSSFKRLYVPIAQSNNKGKPLEARVLAPDVALELLMYCYNAQIYLLSCYPSFTKIANCPHKKPLAQSIRGLSKQSFGGKQKFMPTTE